MNRLTAPCGFGPDDPNPFTPDGQYGPGWSGFFLLDRQDDYSFMGTSRSELFNHQYPRGHPRIYEILADYLRYEHQYGRSVILGFLPDMDADAFVAHALDVTPQPHTIRETDPRYLVHSTDARAGQAILKDGALKSLARLSREGQVPTTARGCQLLGEPADYAEHVCLGPIESTGPECVTATYAAGRWLADAENTPYPPGTRFYFDCHRIVRDGLDVRLCGAIEVHDCLPLDPYLLSCVFRHDIDPQGRIRKWTPRTFIAAANKCFLRRAVEGPPQPRSQTSR